MDIILVDDERWIVAGLERMIARHDPQATIRSFVDPRDAAAAVSERMPDLLITDIRMPHLSGMELIELVRAMGLRFYAVLTGLDDVALLQESIRIQVSDYLIKPVNKAELFELIDRVREQTEAIRSRQESYLIDQLRLCAQYGAAAADLAPMRPYRFMVLALESAALPPEIMAQYPVAAQLNRYGRSISLYLAKQEPYLMLSQPGVFSAPFEPEKLHAQLCALIDVREDGIEALARRLVEGDIPDGEAVQQLRQRLHPAQEAPRIMADFCRMMGRRASFWEACSLADACLKERIPAETLCAQLRELPVYKPAAAEDVIAVIQWIGEHYMEEITLSQAAASVYLQANYFTTLFKKNTGMGFVQYLNQCRVDAACRRILDASDSSFADIAQETGFASTRHFFATFKKHTGQTPGAFRQMLEQAGFYG